MRSSKLILFIASLASGCGGDLGVCDLEALEADNNALVGLQGQCLTCHSRAQVGDARKGAPAGLDFETEGKRAEWADAMWEEINSGRMPPPAPAGGGALSSEGKEAMRNWLACGAPALGRGACSSAWCSLWSQISMKGSCVGCHNTMNPTAGGGAGFDIPGDPCAVRARMLNQVPVGPACGGDTELRYIVAGDANASLLVNKLRGIDVCSAPGSPMPPGPGLAQSEPELVDMLTEWIDDGALAPECD